MYRYAIGEVREQLRRTWYVPGVPPGARVWVTTVTTVEKYPPGVQESKESRTQRRSRRMTTTSYQVKGMTCGHCVSSVKAEVGEIDGVTGVDVDLPTGTVTVNSAGPL